MLAVHTLKKSAEYKSITNLGCKLYSDSFVFFYHKKEHFSENLSIGFTASKRVGGAVKRNLCKRRMKSLAFDLIRLHPLQGYQLVIIARKPISERKYSDIKDEMMFCLQRMQKNINHKN